MRPANEDLALPLQELAIDILSRITDNLRVAEVAELADAQDSKS
jgi:hypothetical protein